VSVAVQVEIVLSGKVSTLASPNYTPSGEIYLFNHLHKRTIRAASGRCMSGNYVRIRILVLTIMCLILLRL
jgi:hypothetical protein